jgi:hypothetical protein
LDASEEVNGAVAGEAAEHGGGGWNCGSLDCAALRSRGQDLSGPASSRLAGASIHGFVSEAVGGLVLVAKCVGDFEVGKVGDAAAGFFPKGFEVGGVDLELALNLFDHQERVGDDPETGLVVVECPLEASEEAGVLGVVVGAMAEEFRELGKDVSGIVLKDGTEAGGAGVAAGTAVAVGGDPAGLGSVVWEEGGRVRHRA